MAGPGEERPYEQRTWQRTWPSPPAIVVQRTLTAGRQPINAASTDAPRRATLAMDETMVRSFMMAAMLALGVASAAAQDRVRLEVYSTLEVENIADFKKSFEAENPDIEIVWNRDSTGVVTARILAEQSEQRADAIWGLAVTSMLLLDKRGLLEPYAPRNLASIQPPFRDP